MNFLNKGITNELSDRLSMDGKAVVWPESGVKELNHLINNFSEMVDSLTGQFNKVQQINKLLEQRVEELRQANEYQQTEITERKRAEAAMLKYEEALHASLLEKDVLLKEVHHRVKNNLAAIIGLLGIQSGALDDEPAKAALEELSNRIRSMSLVHEQLYQSKDLSRIDFQDYLNTLIAHLSSSYQRSENIHVSLDAKEVKMGLDNAIPCGLLITELVTNAFKYAFPAGISRPETGGCKIAVSIQWDGAAYTLVVADNGVGLPAGLDWTNTKTLGLMLVKMLSQHQLHGKIEVDCTCGTTFRLRFAPPTVRIYEC